TSSVKVKAFTLVISAMIPRGASRDEDIEIIFAKLREFQTDIYRLWGEKNELGEAEEFNNEVTVESDETVIDAAGSSGSSSQDSSSQASSSGTSSGQTEGTSTGMSSGGSANSSGLSSQPVSSESDSDSEASSSGIQSSLLSSGGSSQSSGGGLSQTSGGSGGSGNGGSGPSLPSGTSLPFSSGISALSGPSGSGGFGSGGSGSGSSSGPPASSGVASSGSSAPTCSVPSFLQWTYDGATYTAVVASEISSGFIYSTTAAGGSSGDSSRRGAGLIGTGELNVQVRTVATNGQIVLYVAVKPTCQGIKGGLEGGVVTLNRSSGSGPDTLDVFVSG
ncbi:MAG: hypothetical protein AAGJ97_07605, partial [Planctomycetota bacterium]